MDISNKVWGIVNYLKNLGITPHLESYSTTDPTPDIQSAV